MLKTIYVSLALTFAFILPFQSSAEAKSRHHHHYQHHRTIQPYVAPSARANYGSHLVRHVSKHRVIDGNGNQSCHNNTVARKTAYGGTICVDPKFADKFVTLIANLKVAGCQIKEIICQSYGHTAGSNHIGGGACDFDQSRRNVTTAACMYHAKGLIEAAGLYDGCNIHDCGHVEAMRGLGHYGYEHHYASRAAHRRTRIAAYVTPNQYDGRWGPAR